MAGSCSRARRIRHVLQPREREHEVIVLFRDSRARWWSGGSGSFHNCCQCESQRTTTTAEAENTSIPLPLAIATLKTILADYGLKVECGSSSEDANLHRRLSNKSLPLVPIHA